MSEVDRAPSAEASDFVAGGQGDEDLARIEIALGHVFLDRGLLATALRHSSRAHDRPEEGESNERLEFLGDAVIGLAVARRLYEAKPGWREGDLTRALHGLVDRTSLARLARQLEVGRHLQLGRTEQTSAGHEKDSILADAMEALIGAIYLDAGFEPVMALVERVFADALAADAPRVERDPKTRFQENVMALFGEFPTYQLVVDSGIEGDPDRFTMRAYVRGEVCGEGVGRTKRAAEQAAAEQALGEGVARAPESED